VVLKDEGSGVDKSPKVAREGVEEVGKGAPAIVRKGDGGKKIVQRALPKKSKKVQRVIGGSP